MSPLPNRRALRRIKQSDRDRARTADRDRISECKRIERYYEQSMRYQHLVLELGTLLATLRSLGASYEDCERANRMVATVTPSNIGAVVHDIQAQIDDLRFEADQEGIDPVRLFDPIEFED